MGRQNPPDTTTYTSHFAQTPAQTWIERGEKMILDLFARAKEQVPAYQTFLSQEGSSNATVQNAHEYSQLPGTNKKNYFDAFPLADLCWNGKVDANYLICTSSGSSGKPHYWPRLKDQDKDEASLVETVFSPFHLEQKSTLIISCLAMGTWVAGNIMIDSALEIARKDNLAVSVITPGPYAEQVLNIVEDIGHFYDQIVFIGYPPTIRTIIVEGRDRGIEWKKYQPKFVVGGEPVTQHWKDFVLRQIESEQLSDIGVIFGMAEMHILAFETPLAALIRQAVQQYPELSLQLFKSTNVGALMQYNPARRWVEEEKGELVVSADCGIPFLRYQTHDTGGIYGYHELLEKLAEAGIDVAQLLQKEGYRMEDVWEWPFFYCNGRGDSISLIGANIYPHNIEKFFHEHHTTNDFKIGVEHDDEMKPQFCVYLELRQGKEEENLQEVVSKKVLELLLQNNPEYAAAYNEEPGIMHPKVMVYAYHEGPFNKRELKQSHIAR